MIFKILKEVKLVVICKLDDSNRFIFQFIFIERGNILVYIIELINFKLENNIQCLKDC